MRPGWFRGFKPATLGPGPPCCQPPVRSRSIVLSSLAGWVPCGRGAGGLVAHSLPGCPPSKWQTGPWKGPPRHRLTCWRPMGPPQQRACRDVAGAVSVWHGLSWRSLCCSLGHPPGLTPASRLCAQPCAVQPSRLAGVSQFKLEGRAPAAPSRWPGAPALPQWAGVPAAPPGTRARSGGAG